MCTSPFLLTWTSSVETSSLAHLNASAANEAEASGVIKRSEAAAAGIRILGDQLIYLYLEGAEKLKR